MDKKINVLFMQSQSFFGADSMIHSLLMHHYDRSRIAVHVACNPDASHKPPSALECIAQIPDVAVRPTRFGVSLNESSRRQIAKALVRSGPRSLLSLAGLVRYAKRHRIDIVHCTEKPRDAFYGLLLARAIGAKCVIHLHVKVEDWISPLVRWSMHKADALVGVSAFVADSIIASGYPADKTHYVLNSLDPTQWAQHSDGQAVRQEFGIAPDTPLLAVVSRLFWWKGHADLLEALALVKSQTPNFKLLIVGEDDPRATPGRGSLTAELKALCDELDLSEQVIFTGFRSDVKQIMAACDVYTMPSFEEPFGVVFLEAMALCRPVVALDNGGTREVVEHGKSGLLSLPGDIEQLAANIVTLINDPELRHRLGTYGRKRLEQCFHPRVMATATEQVYRQLLQRPCTEVDPQAIATRSGSPRSSDGA